MNIPASSRRRALAIIDVQADFIPLGQSAAVSNIKKLMASVPYQIYVETVFSAEANSLWALQTGWSLPDAGGRNTISEISDQLRNRCAYRICKHSKSAFHGSPDLVAILRKHRISEMHLVGFDINDCVLASAFDAFDNGFFTYVIEECCGESKSSGLQRSALDLLRYLNLTNNSLFEKIPVIVV